MEPKRKKRKTSSSGVSAKEKQLNTKRSKLRKLYVQKETKLQKLKAKYDSDKAKLEQKFDDQIDDVEQEIMDLVHEIEGESDNPIYCHDCFEETEVEQCGVSDCDANICSKCQNECDGAYPNSGCIWEDGPTI